MERKELQIDWLRTFVEVVKARTISAAAPRVGRSQSALSTQLKKLEEAVGCAVLTRGPRHLALTTAGTRLLRHAHRILAQHDEALTAMHGPEVSGELSLGVPDDYAGPYLTPVLREFARRHANVKITLVCEQSTALIPRVVRGKLDVAVVTRDGRQRGKLLFREPLVWVSAMQHEVWRRDPLPVAMYEQGNPARRAGLAALKRERREYRIVYDSSSMAGQLAAVESGLAVAVLTRCSVPSALQILGAQHNLPPLHPLDVVVIRSTASSRSTAADAVDAMYKQITSTLQREP